MKQLRRGPSPPSSPSPLQHVVEVPEEMLKDRTARERRAITRGYLAQWRLEEKERPVIEQVVRQKMAEGAAQPPHMRAPAPPRRPPPPQVRDATAAPLQVRLPKVLVRSLPSLRAARSPPSPESCRSATPPPPSPPVSPTGTTTTTATVGATTMTPGPAHTRAYFQLEDFDNADFETRSPQEWVQLGKKDGGTPARSRYFDKRSNEVQWLPCRVVAYDEERGCYQIVWEVNSCSKWTKRLNIIFDAEDEALWHERVRQAMAYRAETEAALRGQMYVQAMDGSHLAPMDPEQMDRILGLVAKRFPLTSLHLVEQCTREVEELYYFSLKRAQHWREMADPAEQRRAELLGLPPPPPSLLASLTFPLSAGVGEPRAGLLRGTIDTPSPNFRVSREFIAENLFQTHALLHDTVYSIHTQWNEYKGELLCITHWDRRETPLELRNFEELQAHRGFSISEKLRSEWSINIRCTIQNNLDLHFKFYEDNLERYTASRMCRFVGLVNRMMTSQLRGLLLTSLQEFAAFIHRYRVEPRMDDAPMDELQEDLEEAEHWRRRQEDWDAKQRAAEAGAEAERTRNAGGGAGGGGRGRQRKSTALPPRGGKGEGGAVCLAPRNVPQPPALHEARGGDDDATEGSAAALCAEPRRGRRPRGLRPLAGGRFAEGEGRLRGLLRARRQCARDGGSALPAAAAAAADAAAARRLRPGRLRGPRDGGEGAERQRRGPAAAAADVPDIWVRPAAGRAGAGGRDERAAVVTAGLRLDLRAPLA
ncbi:putative dynein heavy chain [Trypanosoma conorhini]|uniref:Putative dynein heavy chain n=1 Tax=Trypanosoma conorhini TaxID=83891 RepID=A0A422NXW4_9TRYP|nr:putative dynein heavy chain [Trypanosoma conorhini]RNF10244.1 putative dynein heavy chain [Trypanosoma conorhini]